MAKRKKNKTLAVVLIGGGLAFYLLSRRTTATLPINSAVLPDGNTALLPGTGAAIAPGESSSNLLPGDAGRVDTTPIYRDVTPVLTTTTRGDDLVRPTGSGPIFPVGSSRISDINTLAALLPGDTNFLGLLNQLTDAQVSALYNWNASGRPIADIIPGSPLQIALTSFRNRGDYFYMPDMAGIV